MHGVEPEPEATGEQRPDRVEVEQGFHQRGVVGDRVHDRDGHVAQRLIANNGQIDILRFNDLIFSDAFSRSENRVRHFLRRGGHHSKC